MAPVVTIAPVSARKDRGLLVTTVEADVEPVVVEPGESSRYRDRRPAVRGEEGVAVHGERSDLHGP
jgi:hypothetical protein